ncbi:unnamed protein product, partial [Didymodactylos carnosus]
DIQEHQNNELKRLQDEITRLRSEHVREIARMKGTFQNEIQKQRTEEDAKVEEIRRAAEHEADQFLYDRTLSIQDENVDLRRELQSLIKRADALQESKTRLEEEQMHLIRNLKIAADLKRIRLNKTKYPNENSSRSNMSET